MELPWHSPGEIFRHNDTYTHDETLHEYAGNVGAYDEHGVGEVMERIRAFRASACHAAAVAWENRSLTYKGSVLDAVAPGILPAAHFPGSVDPVFTYLLESGRAVNVFPETEALGFTVLANAQTAFPGAGSGVNSSGSLFHMLMVPNVRIYNAVSLNEEGWRLVLTMRGFFDKPHQSTPGYEQHLAVFKQRVEACVKACGEVNAQRAENKAVWVAAYTEMWERFTKNPTWAKNIKLGAFFHLHNEFAGKGDHTVGQLHMHVFPLNPALRTNYEHDHKCCAVETAYQAFQRIVPPLCQV
jgi:hypothetical protein